VATNLNNTGLAALLDGTFAPAKLSLHSGAPGAGGDGNVVKVAVAATFAAAATNGDGRMQRSLSAPVEITGATPSTTVLYVGIWTGSDTYYGYIDRDGGDPATNAAGEYTLTTATKLIVGNKAA